MLYPDGAEAISLTAFCTIKQMDGAQEGVPSKVADRQNALKPKGGIIMTDSITFPTTYPTMASVKDAAERFSVSPAYVRKLCKTGKIRYTAISCRKWLINVDSLAQFFEQGEPIKEEPKEINGIRRINLS